MEIIDLTHVISEAMPVFPGTAAPRLEEAYTIERNGFAEKILNLVSHTGTHVDAPGHVLAGAPRLDEFPVGRFLGPALVLDVAAIRGRPIEVEDISDYEEQLRWVDFALLHMGWAKHWGTAEYFGSYPVLAPAAAQWLTGLGLSGVGVDAVSVDKVDSTALAVHKTLFAKNMLVIENLTGLEKLIGRKFVFSCLPLNIADGDGSPIRAVAVIS